MTIEFDEAFKNALESEDELGLVVRAHIHIEASLNQFLDGKVVHSSHLKKMQLDYAQKTHLAISLGLLPEYASPLLALGTLRNAFAHHPDTQLTQDRVKALYDSLSSEDKALVQDSHQSARKKRLDSKIPTFSRLPPKAQFILLAISIRALLLVAIKQSTK
jgi:hypothetical protein